MKRNSLLIIFALIFLFGCKSKPEGAVAQVGDEIITIEEFKDELKNYENIYNASYPEELEKLSKEEKKDQNYILRSGVLSKLVNRKIIEIESMKIGDIDTAKYKERRDEVVKELGDEEGFKEFLIKNNIDEAFFDRAVREDVMERQLKEEFKKSVKIDEADLKALYDKDPDRFNRYDVKLILVESEEEAYDIIRSDEDFSRLAIFNSKDIISAANGGFIKDYTLGMHDKLVDDAIKSAKKGDIIGPIKTDAGYYIIDLIEKYEQFDQNKDIVESEYIDEAFNEKLKQIREEAEIRVFIDLEKDLEDN